MNVFIPLDKAMIEDDLKGIICDISRQKKNNVKLSTKVVDDLGIDSFTALEILVAIELKFKIKLSESEISNLDIFEDLVESVFSKLKKQKVKAHHK